MAMTTSSGPTEVEMDIVYFFGGVVLVVFVLLALFVCIFDFLFCFAFEDLGGVEGEQRL